MNASGTTGLRGRSSFRQRGLSTATAAIVMIVVIIVVGAGAYVAFTNLRPGATTTFTCAPANSAFCKSALGAHDLSVIAPFKSTQSGNLIPFTATLPAGETATSYTFNFGDGTKPVTSSTPTVDHAYANPGDYLVWVQATVNGAIHDNARALVSVQVAASYSSDVSGTLPSVLGSITRNSTSSTSPTGVLLPSGSVTVSGTYTSAPSNPAYVLQPAGLVSSGGTISSKTATPAGIVGTVTFPTSGFYTVTFVGSAKNGSSLVYQNYTWSVFVAGSGVHGGIAGLAVHTSPHPGTIVAYEDSPGGATSLDPATDYESVGFEPIMNVYQTLITYNWSDTGPTYSSYVPQLATCVPGSPQCAHLYNGNTLLSADGVNFTFVINGKAQFYDPATGAHWGVYPSDVMFSIARTMIFSDYPCQGCNNGWILTQALLPLGVSSYDGGLHAPYNTTPANILSSMYINDSRFCPPVAMTNDHGCITFHADGAGHAWPFFLELIADYLGGGIESCGWASSTAASGGAAGLPYWTANPGAGASLITGAGDHPCLLPGGVTTTMSPAFASAIAAIPATAWDSYETTGGVSPWLGNLWKSMVGSGPYYLADYRIGTSYTLKANPGYAQNPYCTWSVCEPPAGKYANLVEVTWETSVATGEQAYAAGTADFAGIPTTDTALLLQLVNRGIINALSVPQIDVFFYPLVENFSVKGAQSYTPNPVTAPGDLFSYIGLREFMIHAYPYASTESTVWTRDGIQYGFHYGGAIPQYMSNYYPANISWPNGDPCTSTTNPNCAGYWWAQANDPSSPWYDPELTKCTTSTPCQFPTFVDTGDPAGDQVMSMWSSEVSSLSGGRVVFKGVDINFIDEIINSFSGAGVNPMPTWTIGWIPDFPDPVDYLTPFYLPDSTYTYPMGVAEQMALPQFNSTTCHPSSDLGWWASQTSPPATNCQGAAYQALVALIHEGAYLPAGPQRVLLFNMAEHIANNLALYVYSFQSNGVETAASWVDLASINPNVTLSLDSQWYGITGNGVQYAGST
jgi:hypothetical protein